MRFLTYNVGGLLLKLNNTKFIDFITSFDIICLTETYIYGDFKSDLFKDFCVFKSDAVKLSHRGRRSGGVILLVKKTVSKFVERIPVELENCVTVRLKKELFGTDKDIMLVSVYIPPYDSNFWTVTQTRPGLEPLEKCVFDLYDSKGDFYLFLCGDFNARTGQKNCKIMSEILDDATIEDEESFPRQSQDNCTNMFGEQLLEFCTMCECMILNGLIDNSFEDHCTYIARLGESTVDYFIMSCNLFKTIQVDSLEIQSRLDSDHMPVVLIVSGTNNIKTCDPCLNRNTSPIKRLIWKEEQKNDFLHSFNSTEIQTKLAVARQKIDDNIDQSLDDFVKCLTSASECMIKTLPRNKSKFNKWFDKDCKVAMKEARNKLRRFRNTRTVEDRLKYVDAKKIYKTITCEKKKQFKQNKIASLTANAKKSNLFWKELKSINEDSKTTISDKISMKEWYNHFKGLFDADENEVQETDYFSDSDTENNTLNDIISKEEVINSIKNLKAGKACGLDGIITEMLKTGGQSVIKYLVELFNAIFVKGYYPKKWAHAIIIPIYKKGDPDTADNYRGVSLLSVVSKCYTSILNKRLYNWLEKEGKIVENQAGFRKNYSTTDHIFTLYAIVQKCFSKKGHKLYVAFIDFKKAFDSVQHNKLLESLQNDVTKGKFYRAIKAMYESLLSCIRVNGEYSDFFECPKGVRQGCALSPTLFSLLINQIALYISQTGKHGIQLMPDLMELFILLFADDIILLANTVSGLQNQLNCLKICCDKLCLEVNREKSKIMIFRKGGYLAEREKWKYDGCDVEVVNEYCYLGFRFTTMLSLNRGTSHLVEKGKKAAWYLCRILHKFKELPSHIFFKIFDSKVQSILHYSSEIWGLNILENIEKVHLLVCKRFLGVPIRAPNIMVYGELGRYPLYINSHIRCLRYWFRVLEMEQGRLPKQAYQMLVRMDTKGVTCWASDIRIILSRCGFYYVWLQQGVGNVKLFIRVFKERLIDMYRQEWVGEIFDKERFRTYSTFKTTLDKELYLNNIDIYCFRVAISQLRLGVLPINNNMNRYNENPSSRHCIFCKNKTEDEYHFLFDCPVYSDLREKFMKNQTRALLSAADTWNNKKRCRTLAKFVFHAMKRRTQSSI